uniref:UPAR/Ly6 domain-containing protein n=1 Tax=Trichobilharzia regenti TaxID=157069 RepID=A0AA85JVX6_TRIRE|nr:unnamed protein product [Trichobilharzia regenti]
MKFDVQILLASLLIVISANYALSSKCYKCDPCPNPFDPLSKDVKNATDCKWCAKVTVSSISPKVVRECTSECSIHNWEKKYNSFSYLCCTDDFCNSTVHNCSVHRILLAVLLVIICFYINQNK